MNSEEKISSFRNEYRFLSNFYPANVNLDGVVYPSLEHAYQAAKTDSSEARLAIRGVTAGKAKRLGRKVTIRKDWEKVKVVVMKDLLTQKFQKKELRDKLLQTGDSSLVEGNQWHDNFWGDCVCSRCKTIPGKNYLGKLLMLIRENIKAQLRVKELGS